MVIYHHRIHTKITLHTTKGYRSIPSNSSLHDPMRLSFKRLSSKNMIGFVFFISPMSWPYVWHGFSHRNDRWTHRSHHRVSASTSNRSTCSLKKMPSAWHIRSGHLVVVEKCLSVIGCSGNTNFHTVNKWGNICNMLYNPRKTATLQQFKVVPFFWTAKTNQGKLPNFEKLKIYLICLAKNETYPYTMITIKQIQILDIHQ